MVKLNRKDAYILGRVAQYRRLPAQEREKMLGDLTTQEARQIGNVIIRRKFKVTKAASREIREAAQRIDNWAITNSSKPLWLAEKKTSNRVQLGPDALK